jgi:hypothetical protein
MMIGSGMPMSHSKAPRPKPMIASLVETLPVNARATRTFREGTFSLTETLRSVNKTSNRGGAAKVAADLFIGWVVANPRTALNLAFEAGRFAAQMTKHPRRIPATLRAAMRALPQSLSTALTDVLAARLLAGEVLSPPRQRRSKRSSLHPAPARSAAKRKARRKQA